jgi:glycine/D-amino acid oxidase-like deaminating enzyme
MATYDQISFWFDSLTDKPVYRPALQADITADVAIIGAGYTGLWSAYYLKKYRPDLNVVIVEAEVAGFGASGRNGGWLMGEISGQDSYLAKLPASQRQQGYNAIYGIVAEVASVCLEENIDCDLQKGGTVYAAARYPEQVELLRNTYNHHDCIDNPDAYQWLNQTELEQHIYIRDGLAGIYTPHCAAIQPAKLARGLAATVAAKGVTIFEHSPVTDVKNKTVFTATGSVKAGIIIAATEGFTGDLLGINKYVIPIQSHIIATQPLSDAQWSHIGLAKRQTFADSSRASTYGQRTIDNRMIFGARGQYEFGGKVRHQFSKDDSLFDLHKNLLVDLFPSLKETPITHAWGGTLGMARQFRPYAIWDKNTGFANAGGYGGEGVGASNLFARTMVDMILERDTSLSDMPWAFSSANHHSALKKWEVEPFRWLTYSALLAVFNWEDKTYSNEKSPPWKRRFAMRLANTLEKILG